MVGYQLIENWKDQKSTEAAYKNILAWADVSWDKVTHMRKAGIKQSLRLRAALPPNFERWAVSAWLRVNKLASNPNRSRMMELNASSQAAFREVQRESSMQHRDLKQDVLELKGGQQEL